MYTKSSYILKTKLQLLDVGLSTFELFVHIRHLRAESLTISLAEIDDFDSNKRVIIQNNK